MVTSEGVYLSTASPAMCSFRTLGGGGGRGTDFVDSPSGMYSPRFCHIELLSLSVSSG